MRSAFSPLNAVLLVLLFEVLPALAAIQFSPPPGRFSERQPNNRRRHDQLQAHVFKDLEDSYMRRRKQGGKSVIVDHELQEIEKILNRTEHDQLLSVLKNWMHLCRSEEEVLPSSHIALRHVPFTMYDETLFLIKELKQNDHRHKYENVCVSKRGLLSSVAKGERICSLHLLSPIEVCNVLDQYSSVLWVGDSLTRHTVNALLMLLNGDFQEGAIPMKHDRKNFPYHNCNCDRQFSEEPECRAYNKSSLSLEITSLCRKNVPSSSFSFHYYDRSIAPNAMAWPNVADSRPILFLAQGRQDKIDYSITDSITLQSGVKQALESLIDTPRLEIRERIRVEKNGRAFRGIVIGEGVQDRKLDHKYPHQRRESILNMNIRMQEILEKNISFNDFTFIDFFNLTLTPPAGTSDGFHYLASTNVEKANVIIQVMFQILS